MLDSQTSLTQRGYKEKRKSYTANSTYTHSSSKNLSLSLGQRENLALEALNRSLNSGYSRGYQKMIKRYFNSLSQINQPLSKMRLLIVKILSQILFLSMLIGQYSASIKTARMYEIQQNWDSAIFVYNDILSKSPNNYQVIRSLKNLYKKSQRYNEGINFLIYQLSKNSKDIQLKIELGEFYFLNENIVKAKATWAEGLVLFKNNRSFHRLLFSIYDKYSLSTEVFQLIESGRNNFDKSFLSIELGNYYQKRNEYDKAIEEYLASLLSNPGRSSTVARKILVMSDDFNSKNTIEMKLLETSLRQPSIALPILSNHYFKHREFQKSFNALIELSKSEPFNAKKWLSFGNNLRKENEYLLSIKAYQFTLKNT